MGNKEESSTKLRYLISETVLKHMKDRKQQKINVGEKLRERNGGRGWTEIKKMPINWSTDELGTSE